MKFKNILMICLTAGVFIGNPLQADAAQLELGLTGGISSAFSEAVTDASEMAEVLDAVVKEKITRECARRT